MITSRHASPSGRASPSRGASPRRRATLAGIAGAVIALLSSAAAIAASRTVNIFIAGDSTAAEYAPDRYPQLGWGMVLECAFGDDVVVHNYAQGGRSTKSFINEGFFAQIEREMRPGDTLLIQFGHNDEKTDAARHTDPQTDYKTWLMRYVDAAHAHGTQPVLITPVTRRIFENGELVDTHAPYAAAMREVAASSHTPLIDLNADSMKWIAGLGDDASKSYYVDNAHFSELGARHVAELVAARLAQLNLAISRRVKASRPALTRDTPLGGPSCVPQADSR